MEQEANHLAPSVDLDPTFAAIYEAHSRPIYYLALRLLGNPTQAEDATHDVFIKAFRKLESFRGDAEIRTWLYRITLNHCSNLRQSWHARNVHTQTDDMVFEASAGVADSPLRILEISELGERIHKTLNTLPEEYKVQIGRAHV